MRFLVSEKSRSATPVADEKEEVAKISDSRESPVGRYVIRYIKASVAIMSKWQMKSLPADRISDLDDEEFLAEAWQRMLDEGLVKNRAELARRMGVSRARVTRALTQT